MTVADPVVGERFSLRIRKSHTANPRARWHNTYEFRSLAVTDLPALLTACQNIVDYEQVLHKPTTLFESFTVSTYVPDGAPYNPDTFVTVPINELGQNDTGLGETAPLQMCWRIAFRPDTGRLGYRLYRNCLTESQYNSPAGFPVIVAVAELNGVLGDAVSNISLYLSNDGGDIGISMESATNSRFIEQILSSGITIKKMDNRYFDVPPP